MSSFDNVEKRARGRPPVASEAVTVRIPEGQLAVLDVWIATWPDPKPSRPEAIRRLLGHALSSSPLPKPSLEERIIKAADRAAQPLPNKPSPEKGVAMLRKGLAEVEHRKLVAKMAAKAKPARESKPAASSGRKGSVVQDGRLTRRALVAATEKTRGKKKP